jgi:hypothetical protein
MIEQLNNYKLNMKNLNKEAKQTLIEMIDRYNINQKCKSEHQYQIPEEELRYLYGQPITTLILFVFNSFFYVCSVFTEHFRYPLLLMTLFSISFQFSLFLHTITWTKYYKPFFKFLKNRSFNLFLIHFYRIKRQWKIKNSSVFEENLKHNYSDLKLWFSHNIENDQILSHMIEEMKFPSYETPLYCLGDLKKILKKMEITHYNKDFISIEGLETIKKNENHFSKQLPCFFHQSKK